MSSASGQPLSASGKNTDQDALGELLRKKRLSRRFVSIVSVLALVGVIGGFAVNSAWKQTRLKEAYLSELEEQVKTEEGNGILHIVLGSRLAQAHDYSASAMEFEKAVGAGENSSDIWLAWSASHAAAGQREAAGAVLQMGMKNPGIAPKLQAAIERVRPLPTNATPEQLAGAIAPEGVTPLLQKYASGSWLDSYSNWQGKRNFNQSGFATREAWAKVQPTNAEAQRLWGEALLRNHRYLEAEQVFRKAIENDPNSFPAHLGLADALREQGNYGKAGLEYVAILKRKPDWLPALMGLGQVALEKNLLPIGTDVFERAVKQAPNNADAWIGLGRAHYNRRLNLGRALEAFQKAAQLEPKRTDFYNKYSNALRANFKFSEAEAIIRLRLAAEPNDAQAYYLLALLLLDHTPSPERRAEALTSLHTSERLVPNVSATETRLGQLLLDDNKTSEAIPLLENVLRIDRSNLSAHQALARAYRKAGLRQEAETVQKSVDELSAYLQRVALLEDLSQRQPGNLKVHRELADLYDRGSEPEKAQREKEMIAVIEKHPERAKQGIKHLNEATALGTPGE